MSEDWQIRDRPRRKKIGPFTISYTGFYRNIRLSFPFLWKRVTWKITGRK